MQTSRQDEVHESEKAGNRSSYFLWLIWIVWLPFLIQPIMDLVQAHLPLPRLIVILAGIALFAGLYVWATWRNVQRLVGSSSAEHPAFMWLTIAVFVALSMVLVSLTHGIGNGNELGELFIFTSAYMTGRLPTVRAALAVVALAVLIAVFGSLGGASWSVLGSGIIFVVVVGVVTMSLVRSITTERELRAAREEIARLAVMTERLRIARDLHDLLGHNLSLIALKSELARRLISVAPERATIEISDVENVARTTLQEVREAVAAYRQPTLASELRGAQEILAAAGIAYRYEGDENTPGTLGGLGALPPTIEAVLAWTVREGVTNVIRHSRARQCTIRMARDAHDITVEIIDDGADETPASASQPKNALPTVGAAIEASGGNGGNGLRGLAERVAVLGGQCEATSLADGFHLAVSVPLAQRKRGVRTPGASAASHVQRVPVTSPDRSESYEERSEQG